MHRRIVSLSLPRFATDIPEREPGRGQPGTNKNPLATIAEERGHQVLAAVNAAAQRAGLAPGQNLADARVLCPKLATAPADAAGNARALAALAQWCTRYTPWTAPDYLTAGLAGGDPGIWLDISGCAHLFDGEAALLADLVGRLTDTGLAARAAAADTAGAAWALARFGADAITIAPPGASLGARRATLAALPVAALRLPPATVEALQRLGLGYIGDLYALPRATVEARFGDTASGMLLARLDQALGLRPEPISRDNARFGRPRPPWRAWLALPEPVHRSQDVAQGLVRLLAELCPRLAHEGRGARRLELTLYHSNATTARLAIGTNRASRDPGHLARLFAERLETLDCGADRDAGVDLMLLEAPLTEALAPAQLELAAKAAPGAADDNLAGLGPLIDRLTARLGPRAVTRPAPRESHLPERAVVYGQPLDPAIGPRRRWPAETRPNVKRPIRLFARPEPVEMTAETLGQPARFRWGHAMHKVARAEGPERLAPEWWRGDGGTVSGGPPRDYYRVEDHDGGRFWLFRQGPDWFLHGVFA